MKKIKYVEVEYIESGTYQGSEESAFKNKMTDSDKDYVVISYKDWEYIQEQLFRLSTLDK